MDIVVIGAVGNCIDIAEAVLDCGHNLVGFLDDAPSLHNSRILGARVIGGVDLVKEVLDCSFVCGIGSPRSFLHKLDIISRTGLRPEKFATIVHPSANVSPSAVLEPGSVLLSGVSIGANVCIGSHTLILQNTVIGHDTKVGSGCSIAAGVTISGAGVIEDECYIGANSSMRENIRVAGRTLIGIGSVLVKNIECSGIYYGNPAKFIRELGAV